MTEAEALREITRTWQNATVVIPASIGGKIFLDLVRTFPAGQEVAQKAYVDQSLENNRVSSCLEIKMDAVEDGMYSEFAKCTKTEW